MTELERNGVQSLCEIPILKTTDENGLEVMSLSYLCNYPSPIHTQHSQTAATTAAMLRLLTQ